MWTQILDQNIAYQSSLSSAAASSSWLNLISTIEMRMTKFNIDHWEDTFVPSAAEMLVYTSNKHLFLSVITAIIYSVGVRFGCLTWLHTRFIFLGHLQTWPALEIPQDVLKPLSKQWVIDFHQWKYFVWEQSVTKLLLLLPGMLQQDKGEFLVTCVVTISSCALPLPQVEFLQLFHL